MGEQETIRGVVKRIRESIRLEKDNDVREFARILGFDPEFLATVLRKPVPLDLCDPQKRVVFQNMMPAADSPVEEKQLYERVWEEVQLNDVIVLTGSPGVGKTKIAYDIGRHHAVVIIVELWVLGMFTPPFALFADRVRCLQSYAESGQCALAAAQQLAFQWLQHLLLSYLEWVVDVLEEFVKVEDNPSFADLCNMAIRCQRNALANREVERRFKRAIGPSHLAVANDVRERMFMLDARIQKLLGDNSFLVWWHDQAQTLFTRFPAGLEVFASSAHKKWTECHPTLPPLIQARDAVLEEDGQIPKLAPNPADDGLDHHSTSAYLALNTYHSVLRAWESGVRAQNSHVLVGSVMHLARDTPAQGFTKVIHVDTILGEEDIRVAYSEYLTAEALDRFPAQYFREIRGRPWQSANFWTSFLCKPCSTLDKIPLAANDVVSFVLHTAKERTNKLWHSSFPSAQGRQRHQLVPAMYFLMRMDYGTTFRIAKGSEEVYEAIRYGALNVSFKDNLLRLDEEPITKRAILEAGDNEIWGEERSAISRAIEDRWIHVRNDDNIKDRFVCHLFRECVKHATGALTLSELLQSLDFDSAFIPPEFDKCKVQVLRGHRCADASTCFLDAFCEPGEQERLDEKRDGQDKPQEVQPDKRLAQQVLHHLPGEMGGADVAFLVRRDNFVDGVELTEWRLVIVKVESRHTASLGDTLHCLDMGQWFPDRATRPGQPKEESAAHRSFRKSVAKHKSWACSPIRLIVHRLPVAERLQFQTARLNDQYFSHQPLVLVYPRWYNGDDRAGSVTQIDNVENLLLSKIRHWDEDRHGVHPQAYLDAIHLPRTRRELFPRAFARRTLKVRRAWTLSPDVDELLDKARVFGACRRVGSCFAGIIVEYHNVYEAMAAVRATASTSCFDLGLRITYYLR